MIRKLLVANRGEIAVRVIRAAQDLGIATVAVFSDADRDSLHVQIADEAVGIGPPAAKKSYLNVAAILKGGGRYRADAVHPGYGFLAENADFADACAAAGLVSWAPRATRSAPWATRWPRGRRPMRRGCRWAGVDGPCGRHRRGAGDPDGHRLSGDDQGRCRGRGPGHPHRQ